MTIPILATKLYTPPTRTDLVDRPRLIERLNQRLNRKLTLVVAPAGFGKTTLVSSWLQSKDEGERRKDIHPSNTVWFSIDENDNDPVRFFTYLVTALQNIEPTIGQNIKSLLGSPQLIPVNQLMTLFVNDLTRITQPFNLVLDDYHHIREKEIHDSLTFLLDHQPPPMHLIIITRRDPPLPLARLRVRAHLIEIREQQLRFTDDEAAAFFRQSGTTDLETDTVHRLRIRTEGWIAGLQMAAISLIDNPDKNEFITQFTGSHRYVADYLMDEVLARQSEATQNFLLQTSVLERFSADLCRAITGNEDSATILARIERANLFLIPLDANRNWYRYHYLFRDFLRHRCQEQPDLLRQLYQRASNWFADIELIPEAIDMALLANDDAHAADLIEQTAHTVVWQQGQWPTLRRWLDDLPEERVRSHPRLCLYHAWALLAAGNVAAAEQRLQDAEQGVALGEPTANTFLGQVAAIRATIARLKGDVLAAIALSRQALERLPAEDIFWRASTALNLGTINFLGDDIAAAQHALNEAEIATQAANSISYSVVATSYLAQLQVRQGYLRQAVRRYRQALELAEHHGEQAIFTTGMVHVGLGDISREQNDLDTAVRHLEQGIALGTQVNNLLILVSGHLSLARVKQAQGDLDAAYTHIQQAEAYRDRDKLKVHWSWLHVPFDATLIRLWLDQGQPDIANKVAEILQTEEDIPALPGYWAESQALAQARLLLGQDDPSSAALLLEQLATAAAANGRTGSLIEILVLQAITLHNLNQKEEALSLLGQSLQLAEPGRYVRLFVDEGTVINDLLKQLPATAYRDRLLDHFGFISSPSETSNAAAAQPLIDPLSDRELQVLRLMAARLSNAEIAAELYLATTTIKWYSRQIYSKLNVNNRRDAVERARELKLL